MNETNEVRVALKSGATHSGYPDNRKTQGGRLVLLTTGPGEAAKTQSMTIDEIASVEQV